MGGGGSDLASFAASAAGVSVDLTLSTAQTSAGDANGDVLTGISHLIGSASAASTLIGDSGNNVLTGGAGMDSLNGGLGNDTLIGGSGGGDTLVGGGGSDLASFAGSAYGVTVNLALGTAQAAQLGDASGDLITGISHVTGSASGANALTGDGNNNLLTGGSGNDTFQGGAGADTLVGNGGLDTASYAASLSGVTVNLNVLVAQTSGGDAAGDILSGISNLIGSATQGSLLTGNNAGNVLTGGSGNDTLVGGGGADTLVGGGGSDTADYSSSLAGVTVNLGLSGQQSSPGDANGDQLLAIANVLGASTAANLLIGTSGANALTGGSGNDTLVGGSGGYDTLTGGGGTDLVDYSSSLAGVTLNLGLSTAQTGSGDAVGDVLSGISNAYGSATVANSLTGNTRANLLAGGSGNDTFTGSAGGGDTLLGNGGVDLADFSTSTAGVTVNLNLGGAQTSGGDASGDVLSGISNVTGSAGGNNLLAGNSAANLLTGGSGNDTLVGGSGGGDTLVGGGGNDLADFSASSLGVTVNLGQGVTPQSGGDAAGDVLLAINNVKGSLTGSNLLTGNASANQLIGGGANDTLRGSQGGGDTLIGNGGVDTVDFSASSVGVTVDLALSTAQASAGDASGDVLTGISSVIGALNQANLLKGNSGSNLLTGGLGNDTLVGLAGADTLIGNGGVDTADYSASGTGVTVNLGLATAQVSGGDASGDVLNGITNLIGSAGSDLLTGGSVQSDLIGGAGADTLVAGTGGAVADYSTSAAAVTVNLGLAGAQASTGDASGDVLSGITALIGSGSADRLTGSSGNDAIAAGGGTDTVLGTLGNDTLDGGSGSNTLDYSQLGSTTLAVNVDLGAGKGVIGPLGLATYGFDTASGGLVQPASGIGAQPLSLINGLGVAPGQSGHGNALTFNNSGLNQSTASYGQINGLTLGGDFTISAWVKVSSLTNSARIVDFGNGPSNSNIILYEVNGGSGLSFWMASGNSNIGSLVVNNVFTPNQWVYVTATASTTGPSPENWSLYVNGVLAASGATTAVEPTLTRTYNYVGRSNWAGDAVFDGQIDDLYIANQALSAAQVAALYAGGSAAVQSTQTVLNFQNITGTANADQLSGDTGNNLIIGNGGADTLLGGAGADTLTGDGTATASYSTSATAVSVDLSLGSAQGGGGDAAGDVLTGIAHLIGSAVGGNTLIGNAGANLLTGALIGHDSLSGGGGADTLVGAASDTLNGSGTATVDYRGSVAGVTINLNTNSASGGNAAGNVISGIKSVLGSLSGANLLTGNSSANLLVGGIGNDTIVGSAGGLDTLTGNGGTDLVDFSASSTGVTVNLGLGTAQLSGGDASGDVLSGFSHLTGSLAGANLLTGTGGNNLLTGGSDNDTLAGLGGADTLIGNGGADLADYSASGSGVTVNLGLSTAQVSNGDASGDVLTGISSVAGSLRAANLLTGDGNANALTGGGQNDSISAAGGNDTVYGTGGSDTLSGGSGVNTLDYSGYGLPVNANLATGSVSKPGLLYTFDSTSPASLAAGNLSLMNGLGISSSLSGHGNALTFNNVGLSQAAASYGQINGLTLGGNFTISAWVNFSALNGYSRVIDFGNGQNNNNILIQEINGGSTLRFFMDDGLGNFGYLDAPNAIAQGQWVYVTASASTNGASAENWSFYINGALVSAGATNWVLPTTTRSYNYIGRSNWSPDVGFSGQIDDLYISSQALNASQIATMYGNSLVPVVTGNDSLSSFQNLTGSAFADVLTGDSNANLINGGGGSDTLIGAQGADTLIGLGTATASYATSAAAVSVDLTLATAQLSAGDASGDVLNGVANLIGSAASGNTLIGDSGANLLIGSALGGDRLVSGGGADTFVGAANDTLVGAGSTLVDYTASVAGVTVNLATNTASGGNASGDVISGILGVLGSLTGANKLTGNSSANLLGGGAGNDTFVGGGGADTFFGNGGSDTVDYSASNAAINVNLTAGTASGGFAAGNVLSGISNLVGSGFADTLTGGASLADLIGGAGADRLTAGTGGAIADYSTSALAVTVNLSLATAQVSTGDASGDVLSGIASLIGSNTADVLTGLGSADSIAAGGGDDTIYGTTGFDTIDGGTGNNTVDYSGLSSTVWRGINASLTGGTVSKVITGSVVSYNFEGNPTSSVASVIGSGGQAMTLLRGLGTASGQTGHGNALTFNNTGLNYGNQAYGAINGLSVGSTFTISAWVNFGSTDNWARIVDFSNGPNSDNILLSRYGNSSNFAFQVFAGTSATGIVGGTITNGQWQYVTATLNGSAMSLYVNGVLCGTATTSLLTPTEVRSNNWIGRSAWSADAAFNGQIDDFFVSNTALSAAQISALYAAGGGLSSGTGPLTNIQNLIGTTAADLLTGDANANLLNANGGSDTIAGLGGADTLIGGGASLLDYSTSVGGVTVNLAANTASGGDAAGNVISGFTSVKGSLTGANALTGNASANLLTGGVGNDSFAPGAGADTVIGGGGRDLVDYSSSTSGVTVDLNLATAQSGGDAQGDVLSGLSSVTGSATGANWLVALSTGSALTGGAGNDTFVAAAGADTITGNGGSDLVDYTRSSTTGVTVDLSSSLAQSGGYAAGDLLSGISGVKGAASAANVLTGNSSANGLWGGGGNDSINGATGNDTLYGSAGNDTLNGGGGTDTVSYAGLFAGVTVDLGAGTATKGAPLITFDGATGNSGLVSASNSGISIGAGLTGHGNALTFGAGQPASNSNLGASLSAVAAATIGPDFTFSSWVNFADSANSVLIDFEVWKGVNRVYVQRTGSAIQVVNSNGTSFVSSGGVITTGAWEYLTVSVSNGVASLYANGVSIGSGSIGALTPVSGGRVMLGPAHEPWLPVFNGQLDDVLVANQAITASQAAALYANSQTTTIGGGIDSLSSFANIVGTTAADVLTGNSSANLINGNGGADTLIGGGGADTLTGTGSATASYASSSAGVKVDLTLATAQVSPGDASGDVLSGILNLIGSSAGNNTLIGNASANLLTGATAGHDSLSGGGGADTLIGAPSDTLNGGGTATLDYSASSAGVTVDLTANTTSGGNAAGDVISGFLHVLGSATAASLLTGNSSANVLTGGSGNDTLAGLAGADTLVGNGGVDLADYSASAAGVTIDLTLATAPSGGDATGDVLSGISNVTGAASAANLLSGDASANLLTGGSKNDTLIGLAGADTLVGNGGTDLADYSSSATSVSVNLTLATAQSGGDAAGDVLVGISNVTGAAGGGNTLIGNASGNVLIGGSGSFDLLAGLGGADTLMGGGGRDTVDYSASVAGVTVDLGSSGPQSGGDAAGDVITGCASAIGSATGANLLTGNGLANRLTGGAGNDTLIGLGGSDTLVGNGGTDLADYSASGAGVTVDLTLATAQSGGHATGDVLIGISNLTGASGFANALTGNASGNVLTGGSGNDTLAGLGGADTLVGNGGSDLADYSASSAGVSVDLSLATAQSGGDAAGDVLSGISAVNGSLAGANVLTGGSSAATLTGGNGADTLTAGSAAASLNGGGGNDLLVASSLANLSHADGGAGSNTLQFTGTALSFDLSTLVGVASNIQTLNLQSSPTTAVNLSTLALTSITSGGNDLTIDLNHGGTLSLSGGATAVVLSSGTNANGSTFINESIYANSNHGLPPIGTVHLLIA